MIDAESEIGFAISRTLAILTGSGAGGKFVRSHGVFGPEITGADSVAATKNAWRFFRCNTRQFTAVVCRFLPLAQGSANIATHRIIARQAFIRTLNHNHVFLATQGINHRCLREGPDNIDMDGAHLSITLLTQVIAGSLNVFGRTTERHKHRVCILGLVFLYQPVSPTGELGKFLITLLKDTEDGLIEIIPAGHHTIHVVFLILHRTQKHWILQVHHLGNTPALGAEEFTLCLSGAIYLIIGCA